jgi:hypothetical protein
MRRSDPPAAAGEQRRHRGHALDRRADVGAGRRVLLHRRRLQVLLVREQRALHRNVGRLDHLLVHVGLLLIALLADQPLLLDHLLLQRALARTHRQHIERRAGFLQSARADVGAHRALRHGDLPIRLRGLDGGRLRRIVLVEQRKLAGAVVSLALDLRALALEQIGLRLDAEHIGLGVVRLGVEQARDRALIPAPNPAIEAIRAPPS